ncbi:hypothetical protein GWK47_011860 [Chionoecetes opilio]|uniref:Uncharacterized protein n=1 Tax=Chionoecetes opilio TaxID=41210 RepID=A0A8J4Y2K8_CHIOP|nr:hypothetical protein GWK47_011860 [Chionoecetes opilio]
MTDPAAAVSARPRWVILVELLKQQFQVQAQHWGLKRNRLWLRASKLRLKPLVSSKTVPEWPSGRVAPDIGVRAGSVRKSSPCADDRKKRGEAEGGKRPAPTGEYLRQVVGRAIRDVPCLPQVPFPSTPPCTPPMSPSTVPHRESAGRRSPRTSTDECPLEAYLAQFELLAEAQAGVLWRSSYTSIVAVLERRYGHKPKQRHFGPGSGPGLGPGARPAES